MKIEYRLTFNDYLEVNKSHLKTQKFHYFTMWTTSILGLLIGLFYLIYAFATANPYELINAIFPLILALLFNPKLNILQSWGIYQNWKTNPSIREVMAAEITETGIHFKNSLVESKQNWALFIKFMETPNLFAIYQSNNVIIMIPKRAFGSDEQVAEFRDKLNQCVIRHP